MKMDKQTILRLAMFIAILFAIVMQIKVTKMIMDKEEVLNAEPLSYAARKYGIDECSCWVSTDKQIWFNQSTSIIKINRMVPSTKINFSGIIKT
jgi:hypothetical protein